GISPEQNARRPATRAARAVPRRHDLSRNRTRTRTGARHHREQAVPRSGQVPNGRKWDRQGRSSELALSINDRALKNFKNSLETPAGEYIHMFPVPAPAVSSRLEGC